MMIITFTKKNLNKTNYPLFKIIMNDLAFSQFHFKIIDLNKYLHINKQYKIEFSKN